MRRFDESGEKDVVEVEERPDRWSLHRSVPFAHATIMMRRQTYIALNGYTVSPRTARGQDRDLWFRFYERGFVGANIAEPLYLVREDSQAIRRRTMKVRFNSFRTTLIGYRRLGYPLRWYIRPVLALLKGAIPFPVQSLYRRWQARGRTDPVRKFPNL
jgi:glycosyltransferase EpsE